MTESVDESGTKVDSEPFVVLKELPPTGLIGEVVGVLSSPLVDAWVLCSSSSTSFDQLPWCCLKNSAGFSSKSLISDFVRGLVSCWSPAARADAAPAVVRDRNLTRSQTFIT